MRKLAFAGVALGLLVAVFFWFTRDSGDSRLETAPEIAKQPTPTGTPAGAQIPQNKVAPSMVPSPIVGRQAGAGLQAGAEAKTLGGGSVANLATREARREERKKSRKEAVEKFLREDLKLNESQMESYRGIAERQEAALKAVFESHKDRSQTRSEIRELYNTQRGQLEGLLGRDGYSQYQDFLRRQSEQYRQDHPGENDWRERRRRPD